MDDNKNQINEGSQNDNRLNENVKGAFNQDSNRYQNNNNQSMNQGRSYNYNQFNANNNGQYSNASFNGMNNGQYNNQYNRPNNNFNQNNYNNSYRPNQNGFTKNSSYSSNQYGKNIETSYKVNDEHKKQPSGFKKVIALVAAGVMLTIGGGVVGGLATFGVLNRTGTSTTKNVESSSYAAPQFTSSTDGSLSVSEAFEKVAPAVVTITTKSLQQSQFGNFSQEVEGVGSGFIINEDGYILTNYHVVEGAKEVKVLLSTGDEVSAKVVNYDQARDMAVVKLADGTKVPGVAELGDSDALYPGEDVIAIGTPLSTEFAQTCTKGIVSAVSRTVTTESGSDMKAIQTDTAINPGNSGGPLINTKGQVIGINSMKLVEDTVEGIGFAIPINEAKERIDSLSKPILSLGVTIQEVSADKAKQSGYPEGLYVSGIEQGSAAEKAGISVGDVIVEFDGKEIKTSSDLIDAKSDKNSGDKVEVVVNRDGKNVKLEVQLEESN